MKAIIALLAFALAGCASTPARKTATPPLPPLPPGFKPASEPAARFAPASAESATTGIVQYPALYPDPDFGGLFLAVATQAVNTELRVSGSTDLQTWNTVAVFSCYGIEQSFVVTTSGAGPRRFLRGAHVPCAPTFQPASAWRLGFTKEFTIAGKRIKTAKVEGLTLQDGVMVWKVLP